MVRVSGPRAQLSTHKGSVGAVTPEDPLLDQILGDRFGKAGLERLVKASRTSSTIGNAERPSNIWYRVNGQSTWWYQYALMDWYKSEVSVLSTLINRTALELFRYDLEFRPRFAYKCTECGYESEYVIQKCPVCGSTHLRKPRESQLKYFVRPNGKSFLEEANDSGQPLIDVLESYARSNLQNNQAYLLCVTGDIIRDGDARNIQSFPLEFLSIDPKFVRYLYDDTGRPGTRYAFVRTDRHTLLDYSADEDAETIRIATDRGEVLYPASYQIGSNYGGTGDYILYTREEVYQDHWYDQTITYGVPIWFDIEDDLLTWHYIEKHNLKKYKFGFVRSLMVLPGFSDEDVDDIIAGIQDVLAKNDNSIPIVCLPPQLNGSTAEMKAQVLELGTESSQDLLGVKNEIMARIAAHGGMPNLFVGDVEASGGMNDESQQITIFDRHLLGRYNRLDRMCAWILGWFPMITDYRLVVGRPSKAYTDMRRHQERMQEAAQMQQLGFSVERIGGEFFFSEQPIGQAVQVLQDNQQLDQMKQAPGASDPSMGLEPGDGEGPPEKGTARREDEQVDAAKDDVELTKRENADSREI